MTAKSGNEVNNKKHDRRNIGTLTALAIVACLVAAVGYLGADDPPDQGRFYLRNPGGAVLFDHGGHQTHVAECRTCHHELAVEDEDAQTCRECHLATAAEGEAVLGCDECHDDPDYAPGMLDHEDLVAIEDHECDGCHTPRATASAYHTGCNACHLAQAPARFADADGQALCNGCHLK